MLDILFKLRIGASEAPLLFVLDSSCCRCGSCYWFFGASVGLASDGFCWLLLTSACSSVLLPAPAGFCLLLLVSACCWIFFFGYYPGEARSCEKGRVYFFGPRSDLDRISIGSCLIMLLPCQQIWKSIFEVFALGKPNIIYVYLKRL